MADAAELVGAVKAAALAATDAAKPVQLCFGRVITEAPLQISVEQKMVLGEAQLALCRQVTEYETEITGENVKDFYYVQGAKSVLSVSPPAGRGDRRKIPTWDTSAVRPVDPPHVHAVGKIRIIVHNALKAGEQVVLLRMQGGQKYLVVDRLGEGAAG